MYADPCLGRSLSSLQTCLCLLALLFLQGSIEDTSSGDAQSNRGESGPTDSERTTTPSQPDLPPSASRKRPVPAPTAPRASVEAGPAVGPQRGRQGVENSFSSQEGSKVITLDALTNYLLYLPIHHLFTSAKHLPCRRLALLVEKPGKC